MARNKGTLPDGMRTAGITRRGLVRLFGAAGGVAASMAAMRLLDVSGARASETVFEGLPAGVGAGRKVVILGAGVSGLTAAYELEQAGFETVLIEARERAGGRNWTLRSGTTVPHRSGTQTVAFEDGQYFNAGPARLPGFHRNILSYCRRFGVALEPFIYENQNAWLLSDAVNGGKRLRHRVGRYSAQGFADEILAKSLDGHMADAALSAEEFGAVKDWMLTWAGQRNTPFMAELRAGFASHPGAGLAAPSPEHLLPVTDLARSMFLAIALTGFDFVEWQPSLMQPVGGMDRIVDGFLRHVKSPVHYGHAVKEIRQTGDGVTVTALGADGTPLQASGDFCISTLPLPILAELDCDLSAKCSRAVRDGAAAWEPTSKMGWQAKRRFWEEDDGIYGGASMVDHDAMQFWYPSGELATANGVLLGCYTVGPSAANWARMSLSDQVAASRSVGMRLHDAFAREAINPVGVDWIDQQYSRGGWGWMSEESGEGSPYRTLLEPDGKVHFAGDFLTHLSGWQEGAALSAQAAVSAVAARVT